MSNEEMIMTAVHAMFDRKSYLDGQVLSKALAGYTPAEVHTIVAIAENEMVNVTWLAKELFVTRGTVSKVTKRLIQKECVDSYQRTDNKKERFFRLTATGQQVYALHQQLTASFSKRDAAVFDQLSEKQATEIATFFQTYAEHLDHELQN